MVICEKVRTITMPYHHAGVSTGRLESVGCADASCGFGEMQPYILGRDVVDLWSARDRIAVEERVGRPVPFHTLYQRIIRQGTVYREYPSAGTQGDQHTAVFPA